MVGEVLWMGSPTVFTLPGRYCYISRRFIERCASDAPVAFALAHEIGHHDLGHLRRAERWAASAVTHVPLKLAVLALLQLPKWVYSRHMELAADAYALELCRKSGFDLQKCLECFDILSQYMLDHRDVDGVYGADEELEPDPKLTANPIHRLYIQARVWMAQHRRTHPSINERRQALLSQHEIQKIEPEAHETQELHLVAQTSKSTYRRVREVSKPWTDSSGAKTSSDTGNCCAK
jgi:Zn-dependent protease with chaperone function